MKTKEATLNQQIEELRERYVSLQNFIIDQKENQNFRIKEIVSRTIQEEEKRRKIMAEEEQLKRKIALKNFDDYKNYMKN